METEQVRQIRKGNKLICKFLGWSKAQESKKMYCAWNEEIDCRYPEEMKFSDSWDWLMPVVRKCVEISLADDEIGDEMFNTSEYDSILDIVPLAIIEDVYKVVINWITKYNTLKNGTTRNYSAQ